ncbi:unnamed protein product [Lupinus luteus]|uniref:Uncharacterized protein n=1 Tax=Lupinus luteus TaxID=3873 RepID=A0AAV1XLE2_LUPLU
MERLDFSRCLLATPSMNRIDCTQKIFIGDLEWEITLFEEGSFESCLYQDKVKKDIEETTIYSSTDSEEGEWWPDDVNGGIEMEAVADEDDHVDMGLVHPYKSQTTFIGGSEKEYKIAERKSLPINSCAAISVEEEEAITKKDFGFSADGKVSVFKCLNEFEKDKSGEHEDVVWEKEKSRKGKGSLHIDLTDIGPNSLVGSSPVLNYKGDNYFQPIGPKQCFSEGNLLVCKSANNSSQMVHHVENDLGPQSILCGEKKFDNDPALGFPMGIEVIPTSFLLCENDGDFIPSSSTLTLGDKKRVLKKKK